jgi:hypothetical protein
LAQYLRLAAAALAVLTFQVHQQVTLVRLAVLAAAAEQTGLGLYPAGKEHLVRVMLAAEVIQMQLVGGTEAAVGAQELLVLMH